MEISAGGSASAPRPPWKKSSYSSGAGCCVEVELGETEVRVRDSKYRANPLNDPAEEPVLTFSPDEWDAFILGVKDGEFDNGM